jgi:hypothetical protein
VVDPSGLAGAAQRWSRCPPCHRKEVNGTLQIGCRTTWLNSDINPATHNSSVHLPRIVEEDFFTVLPERWWFRPIGSKGRRCQTLPQLLMLPLKLGANSQGISPQLQRQRRMRHSLTYCLRNGHRHLCLTE